MEPVASEPTQARPTKPARRRRLPRAPRPNRPAAPARPATGSDTLASVLSSAFTMIAIVCLWVAGQMLFLGSIEQNRAQDLLYDELRYTLAGPPDKAPPLGPVVPVGDPVALLTIPAIGLEQVVVEGTASGDLLAGPGRRWSTAAPRRTAARSATSPSSVPATRSR
jgi:sortase A